MKKGGPPGPPFFGCRLFDCRLFARRAAQPVTSKPTQSEMVCQKKKTTARTMMAMSMGTAPVDCSGWACRRILYDSSRRGCSASVRLRRFFTPRTAAKTATCRKMQGKFSAPPMSHGAASAPLPTWSAIGRRCFHRSMHRRCILQCIAFKRFSGLQRCPARYRGRVQAFTLRFKSAHDPHHSPGDSPSKSQRYDFCQGLPYQGAFWQEKGR